MVGAVGLRGSEERRRHPATATAYGSALALIVDEFALLLDLKNVYWSSDGRKSVDAAVTVIAAGATVIVGLPFWRHGRQRPTEALTRSPTRPAPRGEWGRPRNTL